MPAIGSKQMKLRSAGGERPCPPRPVPDGLGAQTTTERYDAPNDYIDSLLAPPDRHRCAPVRIAHEIAEDVVKAVLAEWG